MLGRFNFGFGLFGYLVVKQSVSTFGQPSGSESMRTGKSIGKTILRLGQRLLKWAFYAAFVFAIVLLVGLIPVNNDFEPAKNGITLYIVSNAVHADIIVPKTTRIVDWTAKFPPAMFSGDVAEETHVAFGWGDKGFFLETETWDDFRFSVAAKAIFVPSSSCVHVGFTRPQHYSDSVSVTISEEQYQSLVDFVDQTFQRDQAGQYIQIANRSYSDSDAFFEAKGRYHALNTCNSWVGRALRSAGVKVPWLSPLPDSPTLYLKGHQDLGPFAPDF